jgi:DNA-binding CsgD family transcriptional regulator
MPTLLERSTESAAIQAALEGALHGTGQCVAIRGAAGLGKSRLVELACAGAADLGMQVARARGDELESEFSFGAALQLFEPLLAGATPVERRELLVGAAGLAAPLLEPADDRSLAGVDEQRSYSVIHGLYWLAANASVHRPLLLTLDDAQWCDGLSLRFVRYLLQRLDELAIAIVVATRPPSEDPGGRLVTRIAGHALTSTVELQPLSPGAAAQLVRSALPAADDELCAACAATSGGNPLLLRELLRALSSAGPQPGVAAERRVASLVQASAAVAARVEAAGAGAGALAEAIAVLGDGASLELAARLARLSEEDAARLADRLAHDGILSPGLPLGFSHPTLREAIVGAAQPARRAEMHLRAARLLDERGAESERVASHLLRADVGERSWAVAALRRAATDARRRGAPDAAVRYLRAALSSALSPTLLAPAMIELARAEAHTGDQAALDRANAALDLTEGGRARAEAALDLGIALVDGGRHAQSVTLFERGLRELGPGEDDELRAALAAVRVAISGFDQAASAPGDLDAIITRAARGEATPHERLMLAHAALAKGLTGADRTEAARLALGALEGSRPDAVGATEMSALMLAATALIVTDDLVAAEHALSTALDRAGAKGAVNAFATASHARAHANYRLGRLTDAIADAESALDAARYGWEPALPAAHAVLVNALIERDQIDAAALAAELPGGEERWSSSFTWNDYLDSRARLSLARGDPASALRDFLACGERLEPLGMSHPAVVPWRSGAARAAFLTGDARLAGQLADRDLDLARRFGAPWALGLALRTAGEISGGDRGLDLLREAVAVLRGSDGRCELAAALAALGAALLSEGHRLVARECLAEAYALAHECGATALGATVRARLVAAGARPRRPALTGRDALTPRERRIATMAAAGMSNREIAEALFITRKTVETHLGRTFRKLGAVARGDLAHLLEAEPGAKPTSKSRTAAPGGAGR